MAFILFAECPLDKVYEMRPTLSKLLLWNWARSARFHADFYFFALPISTLIFVLVLHQILPPRHHPSARLLLLLSIVLTALFSIWHQRQFLKQLLRRQPQKSRNRKLFTKWGFGFRGRTRITFLTFGFHLCGLVSILGISTSKFSSNPLMNLVGTHLLSAEIIFFFWNKRKLWKWSDKRIYGSPETFLQSALSLSLIVGFLSATPILFSNEPLAWIIISIGNLFLATYMCFYCGQSNAFYIRIFYFFGYGLSMLLLHLHPLTLIVLLWLFGQGFESAKQKTATDFLPKRFEA